MNKMPPPPKILKTQPAPSSPVSQPSAFKLTFEKVGESTQGHRTVIYGPGGIGKTTLACRAPGRVAYVDAENSLSILKPQLEAMEIELPAIVPVNNYSDLRAALKSPGWESFKTIALEITRIEEWAAAHVIKTVPHEKGKVIKCIEDYGFGKGLGHVFDAFLLLLSDLDKHAMAGRNVILIAHDCVKSVPNPSGDDWIRYEPRLQDPKSGKDSIRLRVKEWADHVLFFSYDVISEDGKARGAGTKTIYTSELPYFMAKSRTTKEQINVDDGTDVWAQIIK